MSKFVPGTLVQLKSGGAPMTVTKYTIDTPSDRVSVAAMSSGGLLQTLDDIAPDALMKYYGDATPSAREVKKVEVTGSSSIFDRRGYGHKVPRR